MGGLAWGGSFADVCRRFRIAPEAEFSLPPTRNVSEAASVAGRRRSAVARIATESA
jgi:hypothetical protein